MVNHEAVVRNLQILLQAASTLDGWHKDQAEDFIKAGEYGLALDAIAYAYLVNKTMMPAGLFRLFEELAVTMELDRDPEFEGVAKLRKSQGTG